MKNLKTISMLSTLIITLCANAQSEKGFYASFNSGYSLGTGKADLYQAQLTGIINSTETSSGVGSTELVKTNLGGGLNVGLLGGYMFNPNLGLELSINYLFGNEITGKRTSYTGDFTNADLSAKMLQIKPTLVFRGGFAKINPYARVGMVIGSGKITNNIEDKNGVDVTKSKLEYYDGTPIGFHASIGSTYKLNDKMSLFGELNFISLVYAPKKGTQTSYIVNGVERISTLSIRKKELEFVESFTDTGVTPSPNEPSKAAAIPFSFSSIGLNIGLNYKF